MATRSSRYLPALKAASSIVEKRATPGEKVMGRLFPNRGIGYPGGWSADRIKQVQHMTDWTYVAVHTICMKIASVMPNLAFVSPVRRPGLTVKACQRSLFNSLGKGFGGTPYIASNLDYGNSVSPASFTKGRYGSPDPDYGVGSFGGSYTSYMTVGEWKSKALSVVKPQDELEPLPANHLLRRLIENPNPYDTHFDYRYELMMFKLLCGVAYEWIIPNAFGQPCERWVLPSHWVWPRTGGSQFVDPEDPNADKLIQYYEVRPWGGLGSAGMLRLPPDQVVVHLFKSPINKLDGYSKLWAISRWIDTEESISNSRWAQFINQARPEFWVELGPGFNDPDDNMIARWEAKIAQKHQGEFNMGRPIMTPAGAKVTPLSFNPTEMAYHQCLDEETECLTAAGWKKYTELTLDTEIACYDDKNGTIKYEKPSAIHIKPYRGKMYKWSGKRVDAMMTPNHRCYVECPTTRLVGGHVARKLTAYKNSFRRSKVRVGSEKVHIKSWKIIRVENLKEKTKYRILGGAKAACVVPSHIKIANYGRGKSRVKLDIPNEVSPKEWLEFLGMYLSEGCVSGYDIDVCQKKHVDIFRASILNVDARWKETVSQNGVHHWRSNDRGLREHLLEHCGGLSIDKRIPDYVKAWPAEYLVVLFDALMLGDGSRRKFIREENGEETWHGQYATVSKRLADDVMEIATKCGYVASISVRKKSSLGNHPCFIVNVSPKATLNVTPDMRDEVDYDGKVWCVTVPTGLFVVRRNGKAHITGNSEEQIRDMILSGFGVPKSAVGVVSDMTFGSVLATLMSFCEQCLNPLLAQEGQVETKHLGARFDEGDRRCKIWYDNLTPADPAQVNSDLQLDLQAYSVTPNEIRILRGREPYRIGGDNPIVNGPGGPMPLPINVEERMDDLGELVSLYTDQVAGKKDAEKLATMQSNETLSQDEVRDAGSNGDAGGDADVGLPGDTGGASRPTSEELSSGGKVEEPNGKPRKRYAKSVNPSLVDLFKRAKTMEPGEAMDKARIIVANMTDVDIKDSFAAAGGYLAGKGHKKLRESAIREIGELSLASYRNQIIDRIIPIKSVKKSAPIAAGLAVVAEDTGRVLMLQRAIDVDDSASGMWEFPGGHIEAGEDVADAAKREWAEEVGVELPDVDLVEGWRSEDGRYVGFVATVPSEIDLMERDEVSNPDWDRFEAVAWIAPEHVSQMPIRDELAEQVDDFEALANVKEWVSNDDGGVVPEHSEAVPSIVDKGFDVAKLYNEQRMLVESWVTK